MARRKPTATTSSPEGSQDAPALLARLRVQGGREYAAQLWHGGRALGRYCLTARGEGVRVVGPTGKVSEVDENRFLTTFAGYAWAEAAPTGVLSDLGPLFGH